VTKVRELREMADEQIRLVWKDAAEKLFRLRIQAQTEKIAAPSDLRKNRRTIARCQTILAERGVLAGGGAADSASAADAAENPQHEKHARRPRASGRAKVRAAGKGGVASRRTFRNRTQSGK
jgi:large subunit ribosomal protein L29